MTRIREGAVITIFLRTASPGVSRWQLNLVGAGGPATMDARVMHPGYFHLFGARPRLGRFFTREESREGDDGVVVLSHGLWTECFGADPDIDLGSLHADAEASPSGTPSSRGGSPGNGATYGCCIATDQVEDRRRKS